MANDPVCGMKDIDPEAAGASAEYEGKTYYFCSTDCQASFLAEPQRYADAANTGSDEPKRGRLAKFFGLR